MSEQANYVQVIPGSTRYFDADQQRAYEHGLKEGRMLEAGEIKRQNDNCLAWQGMLAQKHQVVLSLQKAIERAVGQPYTECIITLRRALAALNPTGE